jgi:hypothetical protein
MTVWTFERKPVLDEEAGPRFLARLKYMQTRKSDGQVKNMYVYKMDRWSKKVAKSELKHCKEIQARMDFNDKARRAYADEGVYRANRRHREEERLVVRKAEKQNRQYLKDVDRESDDEDREWSKRQKKHQKELYGKDNRRDRAPQPPLDPFGSESEEQVSAASASEEEIEPPRRVPSTRRTRRAPVEPEGSRRPETQQDIEEAIAMLSRYGIQTVTPNGGKSN